MRNEEVGKELTGYFKEGTSSVDNDFTPPVPESSQFYCDALNDSNINMVLNNVKPELIVLLGFANYGKSTFVGSLFTYLFTRGIVDSNAFQGVCIKGVIAN